MKWIRDLKSEDAHRYLPNICQINFVSGLPGHQSSWLGAQAEINPLTLQHVCRKVTIWATFSPLVKNWTTIEEHGGEINFSPKSIKKTSLKQSSGSITGPPWPSNIWAKMWPKYWPWCGPVIHSAFWTQHFEKKQCPKNCWNPDFTVLKNNRTYTPLKHKKTHNPFIFTFRNVVALLILSRSKLFHFWAPPPYLNFWPT